MFKFVSVFLNGMIMHELRWRYCILEAAAREVPGILALVRWPDLTTLPTDPAGKVARNTWAPFPNELSAFALLWWQAFGSRGNPYASQSSLADGAFYLALLSSRSILRSSHIDLGVAAFHCELAPMDNGSSSMESEVLSLLNSNIQLEYVLRRDALFALHSMPFPLREDFTTGENWDFRGQRFWPIWCSWAVWLRLVDLGDLDRALGFWQRDGEILCVKGNNIYWLSVEGGARELSWTSATSFVCRLCDSSECSATTDDGDRLQWADGDVWTRLVPAELEMLTVSLSLGPWGFPEIARMREFYYSESMRM
eukprot:s163_g39.t2